MSWLQFAFECRMFWTFFFSSVLPAPHKNSYTYDRHELMGSHFFSSQLFIVLNISKFDWNFQWIATEEQWFLRQPKKRVNTLTGCFNLARSPHRKTISFSFRIKCMCVYKYHRLNLSCIDLSIWICVFFTLFYFYEFEQSTNLVSVRALKRQQNNNSRTYP